MAVIYHVRTRSIRASLVAWSAILLVTAMSTIGPSTAHARLLRSGNRVVFLGDSITAAGHFVAMLDMLIWQDDRLHDVELINLGLPSETCSGLSEPSHPFPRPNVHERLDRALTKLQPDVVVVCYGMNDGIYHPFSEGRLKAFQLGLDGLIKKIRASRARVVLLTPPPFDPAPLKQRGKLRPADAESFDWREVFENYDDVMARYANHVLQQEDRVEAVIDVRTAIQDALQQKRRQEPDYAMSSDGVHINQDGHAELARAIAAACNLPSVDLTTPAARQAFQAADQRQQILHRAWLSRVGHQRPGMEAGLPLIDAYQRAARLKDDGLKILVEAGLARPYRDPADPLAPMEDQPSLPRVLLIGDSISIGYTLGVRELLAGKANVHRVPTNGGSTQKGLAQLDRWLGDRQWDVIHFNWGLHDLKYMGPAGENLADPGNDQNGQLTPLDQYGPNLDQLMAQLQTTGARLIWCNTTPVPDGARGRVPGDAARYNAVAREIASQRAIPVNDLFRLAASKLSTIQKPANVHFTAAGSRLLAEQVASLIDEQLK